MNKMLSWLNSPVKISNRFTLDFTETMFRIIWNYLKLVVRFIIKLSREE